MAVQFLNDIDLNQNELIDAVIENQTDDAGAGTGIDGQLYYNTSDDVLKVWTGTAWTSVGSDTYTLTGVGSTNTTAKIRLSDGDPANDNDVSINGTGSVTVTQSGNVLTINGADNGVTQITAGAGITGSNLSSSNPTIDVNYAGSDNVILAAGDGVTTPITVASTDKIIINDGSDSDNVKYVEISQITAAIGGGTVTSVTAGDGMVQTGDSGVNPTLDVVGGDGILSLANNIEIDYTSTGIINDANNGTGVTLVDADEFLFEDANGAAGAAVMRGTLGQLKTYIGGSDTTYDLLTAPTGTAIRLDPSTGSNDDVTISGTANQIAMSRISTTELRVALTDDVTITDDLTVDGIITQSQTGEINTFASEVAVPTSTSSGNAVNLGQVQSLIAGVGIFQGGYNATTGLTTDLSSNGSLDGASNIELDKGDYFVVTVAGGAFYSETLEVGDMIYANQDIAADSTPAQTVYTVVIQDENIAGSGSTDGGTQKGVAGFDSATFTVSASGWVQSKLFTGTQAGVVPNTSGNSNTVFLNGQGAFTTPANDDTGITSVTLAQGTSTGATDVLEESISGRTLTLTSNKYAGGSNAGYVPIGGTSATFLRGDGTWVTPTDTVGAVLTVNETTPGTSTGTPIVVAPTTGNVLVKSMAYDGGTDVGHVPTGGSATTFLRGDGTWVVPSQGVTTVTASTVGNLDGLSATPTSGAVVVGLDIDGLATLGTAVEDADEMVIYDDGATANKKVTISVLKAAFSSLNNTFNELIASGLTSKKFTHTLGFNTIIQLVGQTSGDTVYADVKRNPDGDNVNEVEVTFGSATTEPICALVTRVTNYPI
jgi:hypothetical protein